MLQYLERLYWLLWCRFFLLGWSRRVVVLYRQFRLEHYWWSCTQRERSNNSFANRWTDWIRQRLILTSASDRTKRRLVCQFDLTLDLVCTARGHKLVSWCRLLRRLLLPVSFLSRLDISCHNNVSMLIFLLFLTANSLEITLCNNLGRWLFDVVRVDYLMVISEVCWRCHLLRNHFAHAFIAAPKSGVLLQGTFVVFESIFLFSLLVLSVG